MTSKPSEKLLPSLDVLEKFDEGEDQLGYGALSKVRKVHHKINGKLYALKEMNLVVINPKDIQNINREIKTHIKLNHPYIIKFYDYITTPNGWLYLLLEYADNGNLFFFIRKNKPLQEKLVHKFFV
jgi:serine/threonine protein kinase